VVAKVILNPYSARWRAGEIWHEVAPLLRDAGVNFQVVRSTKPGEGVQLAADAVREGFSPIIAAGGDGTIGDVINGMLQAVGEDEPLPPLGILPLGTANDLVDNLKLPKNIWESCVVIAAGKTRDMDLCSVNGRYFANNAALGLEPLVTVLQEKITWLRGVPRYLVAALWAIFCGTSWQAEVSWDGGEYSGPVSLVSVGNGARTGGLFYMTPNADLFDGKLTFTFGYVKSRLKMLALLPRTMKAGKGNIVEGKALSEYETISLHIKLQEPSPSHADGELFAHALYEVEYHVHPARLPILIP
jgi:diacylglycerol kinase (ATP)